MDSSKIEFLEKKNKDTEWDNRSVASKKTDKTSGSKVTLKLKSKQNVIELIDDSQQHNNEPVQVPNGWKNVMNESYLMNDLNLVGNDESKFQIAKRIDQMEIRKDQMEARKEQELKPPVKTKSTTEKKKKSGPTLLTDQQSKIVSTAKPIVMEEKKADSVAIVEDHTGLAINLSSSPNIENVHSINERLNDIRSRVDPDVRSTTSSQKLNFVPNFQINRVKDNYSELDLRSTPPVPKSGEIKLSGTALKIEMQNELLKLERLKRRGYSGNKFSILDKLEDIRAERIRLEEMESLNNSIEFQKNTLIMGANFIEMANSSYNFLDLNGWSDSFTDNIKGCETYLEELHFKYKESIQLAPELKLLFFVVSSAFSFHFSRQLVKKAEKVIPNIDQVFQRDPELRQRFNDAGAQIFSDNLINDPASAGLGNMGGMITGLLSGAGGGGGMFSGMSALLGGTPAPINKPAKANNFQLKQPTGIDALIDGAMSTKDIATLRIGDDLTSHVTGNGGTSNFQATSTPRIVKKP